jgi:hypothetical protein
MTGDDAISNHESWKKEISERSKENRRYFSRGIGKLDIPK